MRFHLYVKIKKRSEGEAKNIMMGAFAGHYDVKHVIVVDEDVDIHDPREVEWAVATRFQADRGLLVVNVEFLQGSKLDPSTRDGVGAKMGLDATKPLGRARDVASSASACQARRRSTSPRRSSAAAQTGAMF